jgi:hypothetical protein
MASFQGYSVTTPSKSNSKSVIGTRFETSFAVASLGLLVGSSVADAILQATVHFTGLQTFTGAVAAAAMV